MIAYPSGCPGGPGECPDWGVEHSAWRARTVSTPVGQCTCQHSHTVTAIASPLWVLPDTQSGSGEEECGQVAASGGVCVSPMAAVPNCHNEMALDAMSRFSGSKAYHGVAESSSRVEMEVPRGHLGLRVLFQVLSCPWQEGRALWM